MAIFKCKMCGGDLDVQAGENVGICQFCGTQQTMPTAADEQKANLFNRANHFRRSNDFDKAIGAYESLIGLDPSDAEAHFGLALSRYGIEYVEDPKTGKQIPTLRRLQSEPFLTDQDYMAAIDFAPDGYSRSLYEEEGKQIAEIQRRVLAVSSQESPYDVFICYKDTTDGGSRTKDSTIAQDIYYQLEKAGHKTFFSRITLESKLGQEYEPYIFSALNSARVMLVVGTQPEYLSAVWVKNEWSRYLSLMKKGSSKLLIPCYRDMDPYDLPEELSLLQSLDMSKIGFMQDLLHGVEKVLASGSAASSSGVAGDSAAASSAPGVESLYKRAMLFLEDGDIGQAEDYFNKVLDIDPEYASAYVGLLMAEKGVRQEVDLGNLSESISGNAHYQKVLRFGDTALKGRMEGYSWTVDERIERIRKAEQERQEAEAKAAQERAEADCREVERLSNIMKTTLSMINGRAPTSDVAKIRIVEIEKSLRDIDKQMEGLKNKRKTLGMFARQEKTELDNVLEKYDIQAAGLTREKNELQGKQTGGVRIEWQALKLDEANHRMLVIAKDCVAQWRFGANSNIWETSEIRRWLNNEFLNSLPQNVRSRICEVPEGKVFLLSIDEANKYFQNDAARIANYNGQPTWWWLRSPGLSSYLAANVNDDGHVNDRGYSVYNEGGVRPALWLNLESENI